jgi:hypothetical protein
MNAKKQASAKNCNTRRAATPFFLVLPIFLAVAMVPLWLYGADPTYPISPDVYTTRQQTVTAVALPEGTPELTITAVSEYDTYGYSHWVPGQGVDYGPLLPDNSSPGTRTKVEGMLNFFTISDIHITDKESPAQIPYPGTVSTFGNINTSSYSPVIMSTTHVLDAAIQTINALHKQGNPSFDLGLALGDEANNTQYNELRWFIDTMDGKKINPSSGSHLGAKTIDYQEPYQTAGLDKSIPWYAVVGNHDQWWCGSLAYTDYVRKILTSNMVLDIGLTGPDTSPPIPHLRSAGFLRGRGKRRHALWGHHKIRKGRYHGAASCDGRQEPPEPHHKHVHNAQLDERILQYHFKPKGPRIQ